MHLLEIDEPGESGALDDEVAGMGIGQGDGKRLRALAESERHAAHQPQLLGDLGARAGVGHGLVEEAHGAELDRFQGLGKRILLARDRRPCGRQGQRMEARQRVGDGAEFVGQARWAAFDPVDDQGAARQAGSRF